MGATTFKTISTGKTAREAFTTATQNARWNCGNSGYTGTIAEKSSFVMINVPAGKTASDYAEDLMDDGDPRIDDKYGPAGCIALGEDRFMFFGWASE